MSEEYFICEIEGTTPLLMNRFNSEAQKSVSSSSRSATPKKNGEPREEATKTAYLDEQGYLYVPAENLFACLVEAGKFHKIGKNKATTQKSSLIPAGFVMDNQKFGFHLYIMDPKTKKKTKQFEVDSRRVVIPATGGSIMRNRARVERWMVRFGGSCDVTVFGADFFRKVIEDAGKKIGLLDYRPARRGTFGKFVITRFEKSDKPLSF